MIPFGNGLFPYPFLRVLVCCSLPNGPNSWSPGSADCGSDQQGDIWSAAWRDPPSSPLREPKTDFNPTMRLSHKAKGLGTALTGQLNGILTSRQKTLIAFNWTSITCDRSSSCCKLSHSTCHPASHHWAPAHESLSRERDNILRTFHKFMACFWGGEICNNTISKYLICMLVLHTFAKA